ncbi:homeobox-leucine zipper protein ATHB-9-like [Syzygium oleosum]|uniref:homeobox-leucine zipper protein ATHB-9-like n=1 Tax=Syzygium oleosum TaxID=219896 RepID=UPI0024BA10CF|nr:homeobox-leucine zipper protein ATHB-9-like [Syzygium oleosum]
MWTFQFENKDSNVHQERIDAYSAASLKTSPYAIPCVRPDGFPSSHVILPLAHIVEQEEFLEVVRLEGHAFSPEDIPLAHDMYLLQLCSGVDENAVGACAQLVLIGDEL